MRALMIVILGVGEILAVGSSRCAAESPAELKFPWFEIRPGIVCPGESVRITAWIENCSPETMDALTVRLKLPDGAALAKSEDVSRQVNLRPKEAKRLSWLVEAKKTGSLLFQVDALGKTAGARRQQQLCVVDKRDPRHEHQTVSGAWLKFPERHTLQQGNEQELREFQSLPSASLKRNLFGISAHLPRSTNDEDPFIASHAVDGLPETCWGSRWWRTAVPFEPEWIEIDLGEAKSAAEVRFLPAWKQSGAPAAFTVRTSVDRMNWNTVVDETDYRLRQLPEGDKLRHGDLSWQCFAFDPRPVRYVRLEATRLTQGPTYFFCCPGNPFQLRLAEFIVLDQQKRPLPIANGGVNVSTTNNAWYNTPETTKKTWPLLLKSGVKLNRIGFWGDKTDWAIVEKTKGTYAIDPEVDRYIAESVKEGVDVLVCLCFGNRLYQQIKDPQDHGPTWHRGHPFLQCAPTTPEAIQGYANYCAFMARHFRGKVKYFEIWNEENGWFFDAHSVGNSVEMVKAYGRALAAAAKAVKQANPDAVVLFGGLAGASLDYPRIAMQEGAGPFVDVFAFHPYWHPAPEAAPPNFLTDVGGTMQGMPRPAGITNYEEEIAAYKEVFRPYKPNIPVWADEMNWFAPGEPPSASGEFMFPDSSDLSQAKFLARFFALNAWLGNGAIWWSLYNANGVQEWAVVRSSDFSPRPAYYSAGYLSTALDDCTGVGDVKCQLVGAAPADLVVKAYRTGKGRLLVGLWRKSNPADDCTPTPVTLHLPVKANVEIIDTLYGYRQQAVVKPSAVGMDVPGLLLGDWPLILRIGD
jgi:hypothetical protein